MSPANTGATLMPLILLKPAVEYLPAYVDALQRGWSPDTVRPQAAAAEEMEHICRAPLQFVESQDDPQARGSPIQLPDGTLAPRLPGFRRWLWDGEFCGSLSFRWQPGTSELPTYCPGHIGYSVVAWKQNRGYAKQALLQMLPQARLVGLQYVDLYTEVANVASQRVILANGGRLIERVGHCPGHAESTVALHFRIDLY